LVGALILRADTIVLAAISSRADVGRFAAANIGIVFAYAVAWLLGTVLLADQVGLARIPSEALSYIQNWRKVLLLVILPSSLALCWLAPRIVRILYGGGFESTGLLASIMVLAVPFILLNATYLSRAIALGAKWVYLGSYIGTAVVAVPLDFALGRAYGSTGVAIAIVLREVLMFLAFFVFDPRSPEISPALEGNVTARRELELWQP
jgi:O-antigen/teichoic acid export membrane protein